MLQIVYRFLFLCMALFILVLSPATPCQANEISVELVWKLGQASWVEIDVEQGDYQLIVDTTTRKFPTGSTIQLGWGGWTPILRINQEDYQVSQGSVLELRGNNLGCLRVKTPEGNDVVYRGGLQMNWENGHWRLINRVDSEDYLKGVVPIEMSNEWAHGGIEALKAQAVAARTFLVRHTENGQKTITDSPDIDQAYAGKFVEGEASAAVDATRGQILVDTQSKQPIEALYSSHSGGYTEDAKNVWGTTDIHNVSHPDPYSEGVGGAVAHWRFIVSAPLLGSTFGVGPVRNVELDKFPSGRVKSVRMEDGFGHSQTVTGRTFVKAFYPFGQPIRTAAFLGSLFEAQTIAPQLDLYGKSGLSVFLSAEAASLVSGTSSAQKEQGPLLTKVLSSSLGTSATSQPFGVFIFEGQGWGHGVGMSQWGAYHMAQIGYTYKEILSFYYNNTLIQ
ncbi:SpoIID/LytB domain-containing protein [Desulfosporosinus sp. OT]|uniref:SpoIID/LytB domain-containing protein n=1 Tax=Desulfosporosinus sp. OT TaxID=913865 RepID=UPI000223AECD|nr:SpoIID/LytB domain-containing protein [Desulfosporosinus sp. OT]EGW40398.1 spoIID/LytB domain protein [Desulfosporosinus sp. OT]